MRKPLQVCFLLSACILFLGSPFRADAIVVAGTDPNDPLYQSPATGVSFLTIGSTACSGALLVTGQHILTAAHCVVNASGPTAATARFETPSGTFIYNSASIAYHPNFDSSNLLAGFDIAIIYLGLTVDASIDRYPLFTDSDELGQVGIVVGWGREGTGTSGGDGGTVGNRRRQGENEIDQILNGRILIYDFDNGNPAQNVLGGTGRGQMEVSTYRGDSGGPTFLGGRIAGIHSFFACTPDPSGGRRCLSPPDIDTSLNGTFGELFGDTRVSSYIDWITSTISDIPEPNTYFLALAGLAAVVLRARTLRR
ncbi:MAG: trypsin-like serine protease [Bryobacteraceae bacterium]|nr:trypsin-like serine protease [Bryobacteraceae bacterium]MDW8379614.1 trypsin-like serine protease [Bryobacterales bacterium]